MKAYQRFLITLQMFKKILPAITIETIIDEYISLVMYAMKNYTPPHLHTTEDVAINTEDVAIVESV